MTKMKPARGVQEASEKTKQQRGESGDEYRKSSDADRAGENGRDSGENSPIYHELDPVVVAGEPPLWSLHDYQSIVDVQRDLVQLRSSDSANSLDAATSTAACIVTPSQSCGDVTGHVNTTATSGFKWTLFSRLRLPRRTTATTRQQQSHVISTSGRTASSPPHSAPAISGSRCAPPSCHPTTWRGENVTGVTRADYFCLSTADVRRRLAPVGGGNSSRDVSWRDSVEECDSEVNKRERRRLVNSSPFSSPCCGVRMAEIRAAWRIQSCGPRIVSDVVPTYVSLTFFTFLRPSGNNVRILPQCCIILGDVSR